jgi:hypothetical protein
MKKRKAKTAERIRANSQRYLDRVWRAGISPGARVNNRRMSLHRNKTRLK